MSEPSQKIQELFVYLSDKRKDKQRELKWHNNVSLISLVIAAICFNEYKSAAAFFVVFGLCTAIEASSIRSSLIYLDIEISKMYSRM